MFVTSLPTHTPTCRISRNFDDHLEKESYRRMMLLIVDDNAAMRRLMRRLTGDLAEHIEECSDAADVLATYEGHHFGAGDWVLMDIEMARMDGLTATRTLCALHPEARVIVVSKHNDEQLREAAFKSGARNFVLKENLLDLRSLLVPTL